jgi:hypothetical protein
MVEGPREDGIGGFPARQVEKDRRRMAIIAGDFLSLVIGTPLR